LLIAIKPKDALHIACTIKQECKYFITTDRQLLKKLINFDKIKVLNPIDFILIQNV